LLLNLPHREKANSTLSGPSVSGLSSRRSSWYPVVFPEKCDGCQGLDTPKCIQFCPHGVFAILDGKAFVVSPQNCVNGCVACRPLCPKGAIEFPQDAGFMRKKDKAWTEGLKQRTCKQCGRVFWTDSERDTCYDCSGKVYADGRLHDQKGSPRP
jgi:NAD-dependent dihydropyrimidine dehydrogenase PreA subunit